MSPATEQALLAATALAAAFVTGALGYGFSSITVPVGLLFRASRVLNPALVLIELGLNAYATAINRGALPRVWPRVRWMLVGLPVGVMAGASLLGEINARALKIATYCVLLPAVVLQLSNVRRPLRDGARWGVPFGAGVGFLYAATTISGPPLALFFNNQGMAKEDFRAAIALFRLAESLLTAVLYWHLAMFTADTSRLVVLFAPAVLIGVPLGAWAARRIAADKFRRLCMGFDLGLISFGLARVVGEVGS